MKKFVLASLLTVSVCGASVTMAAPSMKDLVLTFTCPAVNVLGNSGTEISGFGSEKIDQDTSSVYFSSKTNAYPTLPSGVPADLTKSYANYQATFDGASQKVVCDYAGNAPRFQVSYQVTNAKNAHVISSTQNSITLGVPFGSN
ncbi:MAG: hypothetical protein ACD_45C00736G0013 [uncultured bacterium]|nr:MAG: hypothetical protein ACD_45C00736G0013 [uncultured bacterium]